MVTMSIQAQVEPFSTFPADLSYKVLTYDRRLNANSIINSEVIVTDLTLSVISQNTIWKLASSIYEVISSIAGIASC
jgi:hypothetical protein